MVTGSAKARGRLLATAALRPTSLVRVRVEADAVPAGEVARSVRTDQPLDSEADVIKDKNQDPRCGSCRRRIYHANQVRCPWVSCRAWFVGHRGVDVARWR